VASFKCRAITKNETARPRTVRLSGADGALPMGGERNRPELFALPFSQVTRCELVTIYSRQAYLFD